MLVDEGRDTGWTVMSENFKRGGISILNYQSNNNLLNWTLAPNELTKSCRFLQPSFLILRKYSHAPLKNEVDWDEFTTSRYTFGSFQRIHKQGGCLSLRA